MSKKPKRPTKTRIRQACLEAVACDPRVDVESQSKDALIGTIRLSKGDLEQIGHNMGESILMECNCENHEFHFMMARDGDSWTIVLGDFQREHAPACGPPTW